MPRATAMSSILVGIKNTSKRGAQVTSEPVCLLCQARSLSTLCTFAFLPGHSLPLSPSVRRTIYKQLPFSCCSYLYAIIMGGTLLCANAVCEMAHAGSVTEIHTYIHTYKQTRSDNAAELDASH